MGQLKKGDAGQESISSSLPGLLTRHICVRELPKHINTIFLVILARSNGFNFRLISRKCRFFGYRISPDHFWVNERNSNNLYTRSWQISFILASWKHHQPLNIYNLSLKNSHAQRRNVYFHATASLYFETSKFNLNLISVRKSASCRLRNSEHH